MASFTKKKPIALVVLDGWGIAPMWGGNAIAKAKTQCFSSIWKEYPSTTLLASGGAVGLPANAPGNSEAGHLNLGAGRVVHQDISLIDAKINDETFYKNKVIVEAIRHAEKNNSNLHIMGLLSETGTHSHVRHLYALLKTIKEYNFKRVYIHLFSDGRDAEPMSGIEIISDVEDQIKKIGIGKIISVTGRFFAMDRDNRWGRIARAYNLLVLGEGNIYETPRAAFSSAYAMGQTDEFIEPRFIGNKTSNIEKITNNDSIILFNFRSDRTRELAEAFMSPIIPEFPDRKKLSNLYFASFVIYEDIDLVHHVFSSEIVEFPMAKTLADQGLRQFHCAETEKYPHITYFLNGGREKPFWGEKRSLIPSPKNVKTYDFKPKMSAGEITENFLTNLDKNIFDAFMVNYANADMVGHTGNLEATVQAVEFVDRCLEKIVTKILNLNGCLFIVADHGNAEQMINPRTGYPDTEHTTNPVPFIIVSNDSKIKKYKLRNDGILASVAPTIIEVMGLEKPAQMTNQSIIIKETFDH